MEDLQHNMQEGQDTCHQQYQMQFMTLDRCASSNVQHNYSSGLQGVQKVQVMCQNNNQSGNIRQVDYQSGDSEEGTPKKEPSTQQDQEDQQQNINDEQEDVLQVENVDSFQYREDQKRNMDDEQEGILLRAQAENVQDQGDQQCSIHEEHGGDTTSNSLVMQIDYEPSNKETENVEGQIGEEVNSKEQ
eukprot:TRINITY_DN24036_c0_g1_i3.p3 TRINITY_DN24036_c0_g1~~TRINITY_DN24036_c0_g1_i3.p3  ORF type:complete len:188 (-),score=28.42 TRINITY_DN24036_c0_g1_i3:753-1316(-)